MCWWHSWHSKRKWRNRRTWQLQSRLSRDVTNDGKFSVGHFSGASLKHAAVRSGITQLHIDDHKSTSTGVLARNDGVPRYQFRIDFRSTVDHQQFFGLDGAEIPAHLLRGSGCTHQRHRSPGNRCDICIPCLRRDVRRHCNVNVSVVM